MLDNKVETFLTVCAEQNFTQAARKLHISQPAVTQQIKSLEEYYGVPLFEFEGKHFHLTKYGTLIYDTLTSFHNNDTYLKNQLFSLQKGEQNIYMGATKTVGEYFISQPLSSYLQAHSGINASVIVANTEELLNELNNGSIDFAIVEGNFPKSAYDCRTLATLEFVAVANARHSFSHSVSSIHDLYNETLIIREPGSGTREILERFLSDANHSVDEFTNQISIGNMHVIIDLIRADCGITFLYRKAIDQFLEDGSLKIIDLSDFQVYHEINMIIRKDNQQKGSIIRLLDELFDNSKMVL